MTNFIQQYNKTKAGTLNENTDNATLKREISTMTMWQSPWSYLESIDSTSSIINNALEYEPSSWQRTCEISLDLPQSLWTMP